MTVPVLDAGNLSVGFENRSGFVPIVRDVSLKIDAGKCLAIVGESGSGKSLTSLAVMRLLPPASRFEAGHLKLGDIDLMTKSEAELASIRGRKVSMIFQNPMSALNPVLTIGTQISESLRKHLGLNARQARERALDLLRKVEISDAEGRLKQYPHQLSGGMQQRVMIAIAIACEPDLLIADEPTTALDVTLQAQIMALLSRLQTEMNMALMFISHDLGVVAETADDVAVMYAGAVVERAPVREIYRSPLHPYTRALLKTMRDLESKTGDDLSPIPGSPPVFGEGFTGCPFAPRCPFAIDICRREEPQSIEHAPEHFASCHRVAEIQEGRASA